MLKRKRPSSTANSATTALLTHLTTSRKLLQRTLKTAKGFERQKLSKRWKHATEKRDDKTVKRIGREIEALRGVDLAAMADGYLRRWLAKVKSVREELMQRGCGEWGAGGMKEEDKAEGGLGEVGEDGKEGQQEGQEQEKESEAGNGDREKEVEAEKKAALHNVTSNMYNAAVVRECMAKIMTSIHMELGIPIPAPNRKRKDGTTRPEPMPRNDTSRKTMAVQQENAKRAEEGEPFEESEESSWEGLKSRDEGNAEQESTDIIPEDLAIDEEEEFSRYDHLIGASSDEESFNEEEQEIKHASKRRKRSSMSISLSPSRSPSPTSPSYTNTVKPPKPKPTPKASSQPAPPKPLSTFLPTLYGGYFSGSSSASSLSDDENENVNPAVRKNRPGQMARRAIWEKKYGERANHIKSGNGAVSERGRSRKIGKDDDGWDARRGAKSISSSSGRENRAERRSAGREGRGRGGRGFSARGTGENAVPVEARKRGMGKKDDVGVLHPSWQAAKKAKEKEKGGAVKFEGRKVVFE